MKEPLHDIDKLFRDNIESLQEQPADNVWQNIEAGLDKNVAEKYKKSASFFKKLSLVLLLLLGTAGMYEVYTWNKKGNAKLNIAISKATGKKDNAGNTEQASATGGNQSSHPKNSRGLFLIKQIQYCRKATAIQQTNWQQKIISPKQNRKIQLII